MQQSEKDSNTDLAHELDAREIINSFAQRNIICSVIQPPPDNSYSQMLHNIAQSADIVILDWNINDDDGETVLQLLESVVSEINDISPSQLRLFTIYTGDPNLRIIFEKISKTMQNISVEDPILPEEFAILVGATRIVLFSKPDTDAVSDQERIVEFGDLVDAVIDEFTMMTAGLVSNVAIEAFTHLRKNVFRILGRFSNDLDAPYLTHRLLQTVPEDAEDLLIALLTEEVQALWEEKKIGSIADYENITEWFESQQQIQRVKLFQDIVLTRKQIMSMLKEGVDKRPKKFDNDVKLSDKQKGKWHKQITKELTNDGDTALDDKFADLTSMRSFYDETGRILSLGTVLKHETDEGETRYLLCVSPKCDTVRLDKLRFTRRFPFIPLREDNHRFSVTFSDIYNSDTYLRFFPKAKPFDLELIAFSPSKNSGQDRIVTKKIKDKYIFTDESNNEYEWIGELRTEHALRIVQELSNNFARVGLNESEWLRLSAK